MYKRTVDSNAINDPGLLKIAMLLQGDRHSQSGQKLDVGFDHLWGAGRLRSRSFTSKGLDAPYEAKLGVTCVQQGQVVQLPPLNGGNPLSIQYDIIKAVAWWYDKDHHQVGLPIADVNLIVNKGYAVFSSDSLYDDKERVYVTGIGGFPVSVELWGVNIYDNDPSCALLNSIKVYYGYIAEDSARNDGASDGPSWSPSTCVGVEPE